MAGRWKPVMTTPDAAGAGDARLSAPSTARNREPIFGVLRTVLAPGSLVLEVACGTGEHGLYMAERLPEVSWVSSDPDPEARASAEAWAEHSGLANWRAALDLSTMDPEWAQKARTALGRQPDALVCINMIHIAPWAACEGLFTGAQGLLATRGVVYLYGPYQREGRMVESNRAFDERLRAQNPEWGIRALEEVAAVAEGAGFALESVVDMPANNLSVIFRRTSETRRAS